MGTVYTIPVVTANNLIANGMKIATRNETGNYYILGSNIANSKFAAFLDNSVLRKFYTNSPQGAGFMFVNTIVWDFIYYPGSYDEGNIFTATIEGLEHLYPGYASFANVSDENSTITLLPSIDAFSSDVEAATALGITIGSRRYTITYRDTNCTHSGPDEAAVDDTVTVNYAFPDGYGVVNPSTDAYVTNNGVLIPSTYADGKLTFKMPDPS